MENQRLRHVVRVLYRRCTLTASVAVSHAELGKDLPMQTATASTAAPGAASLSAPVLSPLSHPPILTSPASPAPMNTATSASGLSITGARRKRMKAYATSARPTNELCEVCAETPARKKELLFSGCLHGMCRPCMTAHLKARRRCCHVCQVDFQDRLLEVGEPVTIKHVLAESENRRV